MTFDPATTTAIALVLASIWLFITAATYTDARERDVIHPASWALFVFIFGPVALVAYWFWVVQCGYDTR
jgi:VIT1/CCC1 family predicted Fe2+/Mn2+ transporter